MQIADLLLAQSIQLHQTAQTKGQVFDLLIEMLNRGGYLADADVFRADILARAKGGIAIEKGLALPHAKSAAVIKPGLAAVTLVDGVDCNAMDAQPSDLFFMIACPKDEGLHLQILSTLCEALTHPDFRAALRTAQTPQAFLAAIDAVGGNAPAAQDPPQPAAPCHILAVTSCPIGIAHTYMAAEALEAAAAARGVSIKVETNGSAGKSNQLTPAEIAEADGIIVAADTSVALRRFAGKPVVFVPVAEAIRQPEALIATIQSGEAPLYAAPAPAALPSAKPNAARSTAHALYTHLMTGFSHALPLLVICGALWGVWQKVSPCLTDGTAAVFAMFCLTDLAAATLYLAPIALSGFLAMSIADRPGLVLGLVAGAVPCIAIAAPLPLAGAQMCSGFLGALVAGFLAGYLARGLSRLFAHLPKSMEPLTPVFFLPVVGSLLVGCLVIPSNIAVSLVNAQLFRCLNALPLAVVVALAGGLAGLLAVDMGGPCNKASYLITIGLLFTEISASPSNSGIATQLMAAVLVGGMVPPLAAGLCALLLPGHFTAAQRKKAPESCIAGLCFVTEGALAFTEENGAGVKRGCIAGSAVAGALSAALGCSITVPHGGIFVIWLSNHPVFCLLALVVGTLVGMLAIAAFQPGSREKTGGLGG